LTINSFAYYGFLVGGSLIDNLTSRKGKVTFPPFEGIGIPSIPVTDNEGNQPFKIKLSRAFGLTFFKLLTVSKVFTAYCPFCFARSYIYLYLFGGI